MSIYYWLMFMLERKFRILNEIKSGDQTKQCSTIIQMWRVLIRSITRSRG